MRIEKPLSRQDADQQMNGNLLPPGTYDFVVTDAEERSDKKGRPFIKLTLAIHYDKGRIKQVACISEHWMAWRMRHFFDAVGLSEMYDNGTIDVDALVNRNGVLQLEQETTEPNEAGRVFTNNSVRDYGPPTKKDRPQPGESASESAMGGRQSQRALQGINPDEIPF